MNTNKDRIIKLVACGAAVAVMCTGIGAAALSAGTLGNETLSPASATAGASDENNSGQSTYKDETVYVIAGADGSVEKIYVSDWIKNNLGLDKITDGNKASDVKNVRTDASYTLDTDNMRVWDAAGEDIYSQGTISKALPVDLSVSYKLDGKTVTPEELAGKSGRVTMRFDYTNKQYENVSIDGVNTKIYVPFVMLTGTILDNDTFKNVSVTNGKLINDGSRTIVAGFALPGMQQNLNISASDFEIPDYVEISADAENFELTTTLTLASNEFFADVDTAKLDSADDITSSLNELNSAMSELLDGSSRLYSGMRQLNEKCGSIITGVDTLADSITQLRAASEKIDGYTKQAAEGADGINSGAELVASGVNALHEGIGKMVVNNDKLTDGAKQTFDVFLSQANTQIAAAGLTIDPLTVENYAAVLDDECDKLAPEKVHELAVQTALEKATAAVEANSEAITAGVTEAYKAGVTEAVLKAAGQDMTAEQYAAAIEANQIPATLKNTVDATVSVKLSSDDGKAAIAKLTADKKQELITAALSTDEAKQQLSAAEAAAAAGLTQLKALKTQLDKYNELYQGIIEYTAGAAEAYEKSVPLGSGADELTSYTKQLSDSEKELNSGTNEFAGKMGELESGVNSFNEQMPALESGVNELTDGAMQLSDGLKQFNEQGISKITSLVGDDIAGLAARLKATIDVSKDYKSFASSGDMDGQVRFIYKTDAIKAD